MQSIKIFPVRLPHDFTASSAGQGTLKTTISFGVGVLRGLPASLDLFLDSFLEQFCAARTEMSVHGFIPGERKESVTAPDTNGVREWRV